MNGTRDLIWNSYPVSGTSHQTLSVDGTKSKLVAHPDASAISLPVCAETKAVPQGGECYQILCITPGQGRAALYVYKCMCVYEYYCTARDGNLHDVKVT